jgi:chromate reductase, NAD(P)H dehydrogenase (quinone)
MNIVAFGASSSKQSINQQLAHYAAHFFDGNVYLLDLNDFEMPLFSVDRELEDGIPEEAEHFLDIIGNADLLVISMAEHNDNYTAAFKTLFDWSSRSNVQVFQNKPLFLLSTSPGGYGGGNVMQIALTRFPKHGAKILGHFSLPSFGSNFDNEIINDELKAQLEEVIKLVKDQL